MAESVQIQSVSHRHEAIADMFLAFPHLRKQDIAAKLGVSKEWLSIVINSDVFKEYWSARRASYEGLLREKLVGAQLQLALDTYNRLSQMVGNPECKEEFVLNVAEHNLKVLGYEPRKTARVTEEKVQEYSQPVNAALVASARETMRRTVTVSQEVPLESLAGPA